MLITGLRIPTQKCLEVRCSRRPIAAQLSNLHANDYDSVGLKEPINKSGFHKISLVLFISILLSPSQIHTCLYLVFFVLFFNVMRQLKVLELSPLALDLRSTSQTLSSTMIVSSSTRFAIYLTNLIFYYDCFLYHWIYDLPHKPYLLL